jgi:hypothetical protein
MALKPFILRTVAREAPFARPQFVDVRAQRSKAVRRREAAAERRIGAKSS